MSRLQKLEKGMWSQSVPKLPLVSGVFMAYFHHSDLYFRIDPEMNQILEELCHVLRNS